MLVKMVRAGVEPHLLDRKRPIQVVELSYESMVMAMCVLTRAPVPHSGLKYSMQRATPSRLGNSDDVC
ncbi:unnamed protein product [Haemonchus placei]|uniref:Calponin-homology (CH) domain-containing protein n=1 Tax=Haemonchus placei TaxID=6290 RepID=A0A0N4VS21_HAEPC|nr:unnamed protein product [Haemonchus placei]